MISFHLIYFLCPSGTGSSIVWARAYTKTEKIHFPLHRSECKSLSVGGPISITAAHKQILGNVALQLTL